MLPPKLLAKKRGKKQNAIMKFEESSEFFVTIRTIVYMNASRVRLNQILNLIYEI